MPLDDSLIKQPDQLPDLRDWQAPFERALPGPNIGTPLASPLSAQARTDTRMEREDAFLIAMLQRRRWFNLEQVDQEYPPANLLLWSTPRGSWRQKWLDAALRELQQCDEEANEVGYPAPSIAAKQNAKRILQEIAGMELIVPPPAVYPTADREIAMLFRRATARAAVLITCDADGGGACFSIIAGKNRRARYDDAGDLPGAFVLSELQRLRQS